MTQPHKVPIVLKAETSAGAAFLLSSAAGSRSLTSSGLSTPYFPLFHTIMQNFPLVGRAEIVRLTVGDTCTWAK